jgi:cytochrome c oxidase assembly protein subunit 11
MGIVAGMGVLAFASVPAYRAFCQQFGFAGTPRVDAGRSSQDAYPVQTSDRAVTVRFNADTNGALPWNFHPVQGEITVGLGEESLAFYQATNDSDRPITGTATFNVTPLEAAKYFVKTECFCFTEQTLGAGETVSMPVSFYIDPALSSDPALEALETVTLSYTFFETSQSRLLAAATAH